MECEFDIPNMVGTSTELWHVQTKCTKKHKPRLFLNQQRCYQNYIIPTGCHPVFPILSSRLQCKYRIVGTMKYVLIPFNDIGLCETSSKEINSVWYQVVPYSSPKN
jgi:hypothetical protein